MKVRRIYEARIYHLPEARIYDGLCNSPSRSPLLRCPIVVLLTFILTFTLVVEHVNTLKKPPL